MTQAVARALVLFGDLQAVEPPRDWAWFRATTTNTAWWVTEGQASVQLSRDRFEAKLYDKSDSDFLRASLIGGVVGREIKARVRIESSDTPEYQTVGHLRRFCWRAGGGREVILFTNGNDTIGLAREFPLQAKCTPA
jgi:hypothetical protein